jgi:L-ribulose-5-phosphate 3-epimerase
MDRKEPEQTTSRRDFLREGLRSLLQAGLGGLAGRLEAAAGVMEGGKPRALYHVLSCETYSAKSLLESELYTMETLPSLFRELELRGISINGQFLTSWEPRYLENLRDIIQKNGMVVTALIAGGNLATSDPVELDRQLQEDILKIEAAAILGAPLIRMDTGSTGIEREDDTIGIERVAQAINRLLPVAQKYGVRITIENHGGVSKKAENIMAIIRNTDPKWVGACLDFGNWTPERLYDSCRVLAPFTLHVHAKAYAFDARGEETQVEYGRVLSYLKMVDYQGALSIEYEGEEDPVEGVKKTRDLIRRYWRGV